MKSEDSPAFFSKARRDLAIAVLSVVVLFLVASAFDLNEAWHIWAEAHEDLQLDEIPIALSLGFMGLAWYACRRWSHTLAVAKDLALAQEQRDRNHQQLLDSVKSISSGIAIWSADDQLVLSNDRFLRFHNDGIRKQIAPGMKYEDLLRARYATGDWNSANRGQEWIAEELRARRQQRLTKSEFQLMDGRFIILEERVHDNGEIINTVVDVSDHHRREAELQDAKRKLENIAYFDGLTGLANRTHCQEDINRILTSADSRTKFALVQFDLDNFKRVNDTLGHSAGDHLLSVLGVRLSLLEKAIEHFKPYRWGGDEFVALINLADGLDLDALCQELNDVIGITVEFEHSILRPTASLGVARFPEDAKDLNALMIFADLALYKSKELGRDNYQFFSAEMKDNVDAEARIEKELRNAIENGELEMYFQPQIDSGNEAIVGTEALLRWNHPKLGVVKPGAFLSVAETAGLAEVIGCMVFEQAMSTARGWVDDGLEFGRMAINLSPMHLKKSTVLDDFFDAMDRHGIEPQFLAVEFLESFVLDDPNADIAAILEKLLARGIHVELDDFGTGYASLSHLSTMPIDGLKIDRSFVQDMVDDPKQMSIVSSLVSMAKLMNLRVVCEGIETQQQFDAAKAVGDCAIQGYFVARPMRADAMTQWIKGERNIGCLKTRSCNAATAA